MDTMNATATEARQHFNRYVNWVDRGAARVRIVRHDRVVAVLVSERDAERLRALDESEQAKQAPITFNYSPEERAEIDRRIWDPKVRALMGLPPLAQPR